MTRLGHPRNRFTITIENAIFLKLIIAKRKVLDFSPLSYEIIFLWLCPAFGLAFNLLTLLATIITMRFLIIRPPYLDVKTLGQPRVGMPVGPLSVAASLEKAGHTVMMFDSLVYSGESDDPNHFGASFQHIEQVVRDFHPDIVGVTNLFSTQMSKAFAVTDLIKKVDKNIKVVVGGPHATAVPQDFLASQSIDMVVVGEGELTVLDIVDYYVGKKEIQDVKGAAYMQAGMLKVNAPEYIQDLDSLPYPAYHLVDMEKYFQLAAAGFGSRPNDIFYQPMREVSMITSRGCPFECTFCAIHPTMGYKYRMQSPEYVVEHIELLVKQYRVNFIHFEDDNLTLSPPRFEKVLDMLWEKQTLFEWDTPNGVRADALPRRLLEKIKRSGVRELRIAIESADQSVLENVVRKRLDLDKVMESVKNCKELGIQLSAFYVVGMPGETKELIQKTMDFAYNLMKNYNVLPHVNVAMPLVGTEMYDIAVKNNYIVKDDYTTGAIFGTGMIRTPEFGPEDIKAMTSEFYRRIRNLYIRKTVSSPKKMVRNMKIFIRYPRSTMRILKTAIKFTEKANM